MVIKQEEFDVSKFTIEEGEGKIFKKAWFNYDGKLPVIELEGTFRDGKRVYSLGVDIYNTSFDFRGLEKRLSELAGESLSSDPESFKLIKKAKKGRMVYLRVLTNSYGTPQSIFYERGNGSIDFEDRMGKEFEGKCKMIVSFAFKGI